MALPERVAYVHAGGTAAGLVIGGGKEAPENGLDAKDIEEIAADPDALGIVGLAAGSEVELVVAPDREEGKGLLTLADLLPYGKSELGVIAAEIPRVPRAVGDADNGQLVRIPGGDGA